MELKLVIYSIRNRYAHVYVTVRRMIGWHRCLLWPHGYIDWHGFKYWTWILLIWSISVYLDTCSHIQLVGFTHDELRRSSITCCYYISSSAWVFIKICGASAKHSHITWQQRVNIDTESVSAGLADFKTRENAFLLAKAAGSLFVYNCFSLSLLSSYGLVLWGWRLRTDRVSATLSRLCIAIDLNYKKINPLVIR